MTQERYFIGPGLRDKLRETIARVDGMMGREGGVKSPIVHQEMMPRGGGKAVRICKTTAAWLKNTTATLQVWEAGDPGAEQASTGEVLAGVVNKIGYVAAGMFVLVAKATNGGWYLVESEMPSVLFSAFTAPWDKASSRSLTLSVGTLSFAVNVTNSFANITGTGSRACAVGCDGVNFRLIAAEC